MAIAEIHITLKPALFDAQGATVTKALHQLGHTLVRNARIGKYITVEIDDALAGPALQEQLDRMCQQLLANPVIENYEITLDTTGPAPTVAPATAPTVIPSPVAAVNTADARATRGAPAMAASMNAPATNAPGMAVTPGTGIDPATMVRPRQDATSAVTTPAMPLASSSEMATPPTVSPITATPTLAGTPSAVTPGATATVMPPESGAVADELRTPGGLPLPDPFAVDFVNYSAMSSDAQLALQERAWGQHGPWIVAQLDAHRAAWIMCVGGRVLESGATLDSYPDEERQARMGAAHGLVAWVFTRPPAS